MTRWHFYALLALCQLLSIAAGVGLVARWIDKAYKRGVGAL